MYFDKLYYFHTIEVRLQLLTKVSWGLSWLLHLVILFILRATSRVEVCVSPRVWRTACLLECGGLRAPSCMAVCVPPRVWQSSCPHECGGLRAPSSVAVTIIATCWPWEWSHNLQRMGPVALLLGQLVPAKGHSHRRTQNCLPIYDNCRISKVSMQMHQRGFSR